MSTYSQIAWLPLTAGLTLIGLIASWVVWRRRGAAAGLRVAAWSLLPVALYLIGAIELLWRFGTAIGSFAASFVFSPKVWVGFAVIILALVLFTAGRGLRGRARKRSGGQVATTSGNGAVGGAAKPTTAISPSKGKGRGKATALDDDDDLADVAAILRRRGIS
jgi:hypothetical protein